jgi:hypothetical protein
MFTYGRLPMADIKSKVALSRAFLMFQEGAGGGKK